jgi:hypothetical protein
MAVLTASGLATSAQERLRDPSLIISAKPVIVGAVSQRLIPTGEQSGSLMHIAATESVMLCTRMKS